MKITKYLQLALPLFAALFIATAAQAQTKVNGVTIPQSRIDVMIKNAVSQGQTDTPELRARARDELITREVLLQEATKKGLDKNPDIQAQLELQRQNLVINGFLADYVKANPITDDVMRKEYDNAKSASGGMEYKARHILVKTEDEAKQIIAQLKKGGSFDKIAAEKSLDTGSKAKGGDLDWSPPNRYVKPFSDALTKLKKGQTTDTPVQTQYGYHVIRLDDVRPLKIPSFEEAKPAIQQQMQGQEVQRMITDLRSKAKVE